MGTKRLIRLIVLIGLKKEFILIIGLEGAHWVHWAQSFRLIELIMLKRFIVFIGLKKELIGFIGLKGAHWACKLQANWALYAQKNTQNFNGLKKTNSAHSAHWALKKKPIGFIGLKEAYWAQTLWLIGIIMLKRVHRTRMGPKGSFGSKKIIQSLKTDSLVSKGLNENHLSSIKIVGVYRCSKGSPILPLV